MNTLGSPSLSGRVVRIPLCGRCRREILPQLKAASWQRDVHREAAVGMVTEPDPAADRKRAQKARKAAKRQPHRIATRAQGFAAMAKQLLTTRGVLAPVLDENCPDCLKLTRSCSSSFAASIPA